MTHVFEAARQVNSSLPAAEFGREAARARASVAFLSSILDNAPDPVIAADLEGLVIFANSAASELLGRPVAELVGSPLRSTIPCSRDVSEIVDGLRDRELTRHDLEITSVDGNRMTSVSSRRLRLPTGEVVGNVVFLRDVSERYRAERALAAKNEELESYVSHVSHDLRSPLVSVLGFARLLRQEYSPQLDDAGQRFVDRIVQAGHTMESLIEDLLELSRIGRVDEPDTLVDPLGVIQQVIADQKTQFEGCEVQIDSPVQPPMLLCNRTRVYQIFSNLIGNAMAHMGPVDAPCVEVSIEDEAGLHHIRVADNGKGVAPENHEKIFEVFSTLGRRADGRKPTGVGLAIVRKIAVQHGGSAWVESPIGGGCIFHVTLRAS
jgi:PAS domain S-box-containing protein